MSPTNSEKIYETSLFMGSVVGFQFYSQIKIIFLTLISNKLALLRGLSFCIPQLWTYTLPNTLRIYLLHTENHFYSQRKTTSTFRKFPNRKHILHFHLGFARDLKLFTSVSHRPFSIRSHFIYMHRSSLFCDRFFFL